MSKGKARSESKQAVEMEPGVPALAFTPDLWYKIHVLLYDLCNIATDRAAEARTLATTDELYISAPYFTPSEATLIKTTRISPPVLNETPEFEMVEYDDGDEVQQNQAAPSGEPITIEEAIKACLQNFFEKRRASGDARPCGPHDMAPIYLAVFGIAKDELKDEKFTSRLRRAGLPLLQAETAPMTKEQKSGQKAKKGGKKRK
jgi:hypothetical protein